MDGHVLGEISEIASEHVAALQGVDPAHVEIEVRVVGRAGAGLQEVALANKERRCKAEPAPGLVNDAAGYGEFAWAFGVLAPG